MISNNRNLLPKRKVESTLALINVVFLMLIFFLIAGTLAPPSDSQVKFVSVGEEDPAPPPDMLVIRADGMASWNGEPVDVSGRVQAWLDDPEHTSEKPLRIAPDRALPAEKLVSVIETIRQLGVQKIVLVSERGQAK